MNVISIYYCKKVIEKREGDCSFVGARANSLVRREYAVAVIALCSGSTENCERNKEVQHLPKAVTGDFATFNPEIELCF